MTFLSELIYVVVDEDGMPVAVDHRREKAEWLAKYELENYPKHDPYTVHEYVLKAAQEK
jgi:hypothetical protein